MKRMLWKPVEGVVRHGGKPIPVDMDFFMIPPLEIGSLISAESTLYSNKTPLSQEKRILIIATVVIGIAIVTEIILNLFLSDIIPAFSILIVITTAFTGGAIAFLSTRFLHKCSYVGKKGVVEFTLNGEDIKKRLFLFNDAEDLLVNQIRHYYNGIYTTTSYDYQWKKSGKNVFRLFGNYKNEKGIPEDKHPWHFASAAEGAWNMYMLEIIGTQLEKLGYVEFPIASGNPKIVRVGENFMEFVLRNGEIQRVMGNDMKDITLGSGIFRFNHKDAKWWSGKGKYSFNYAKIPNAKLFLLCLDKLMGIRWN